MRHNKKRRHHDNGTQHPGTGQRNMEENTTNKNAQEAPENDVVVDEVNSTPTEEQEAGNVVAEGADEELSEEAKLRKEVDELKGKLDKAKNDELRGRDGGFDKGYRILLKLKEMGVKDIGFGCTVSNNNSSDMLELYKLSRELNLEFATAAFHNSFYFHKDDNRITNTDRVIADFEELINLQLKERHPKSWFRAYFNMGLINYIEGNRRMLPCEAGTANFFIDPWGEVYPCNGMESKYWKESMGNKSEAKRS